MTTARHGSGHVDRPHPARVGAGIGILVVAALPVLALMWLAFDYATQEYTGTEAELMVFAMVIVAMVALQLASSGVALIRSGRSGEPVSRIYLVGLGVLVIGFGGTYIVNHTVEGAEYVELLYALSLIIGTAAMAVGAFVPPLRRSH
jgi:hypothetical protein